ncbi:MAG: hypothetical protein M1816_001501 [Peltula sp. TS41687]|nr:MAG: hypothetical protein M1816_001501 [Peltula sp. TS41687]
MSENENIILRFLQMDDISALLRPSLSLSSYRYMSSFNWRSSTRIPSTCKDINCQAGDSILPLHLRLLLWTCPSECDYTCQHIITSQRLAQRSPPLRYPIVQFHGKWPFQRILGIQEFCSVLFSLLNLLAHRRGLDKIRASIPHTYPLRSYYLTFGYLGVTSWLFSMLFHTRDLGLTEKADYFAAAASVLYGLYLAVVRVFRLDLVDHHSDPHGGRTRGRTALLRLWSLVCIALYAAHVAYLTLWNWDYTYNMTANVGVGGVQNLLWSWFSVRRYRRLKQPWAAWPGMIVAWIMLAMSLELLDFPPLLGLLDAHSLWHLGTVAPTIWWYRFLVKDAQEDLQATRIKA